MARLGDVCDVFAGQGAPQGADTYCDSKNGTPFIKAGDLSDLLSGKLECEIQCVTDDVAQKHKLKLYPAGSILFAKSGMSCMKGYVYRIQNPSYVVSHLAILVPKKVDGEYLKFYLEFHKPNSLIKDSAYPSISLQDISNMELNVPCLEKQKEFANNLQRINKLITFRKQQLSTLEDLVKSRFIEMFGDVPEAEHTTMPEVCSIITDGTHQPPKFVSSGIPFLFVSNIVTNKITYNAEKFISEETYKELMKRTPIEIGDILLSTVGSYGHPAVVETDRPFSFQRHIAYLKPKKDVINSIYLYGALLSADVQKQIDDRVKGIAQKTLNLSEIRKLHFPLPSMEVQNEFATFVEQTDKLKFEVKQGLEKLEILKKSFMQQYFG